MKMEMLALRHEIKYEDCGNHDRNNMHLRYREIVVCSKRDLHVDLIKFGIKDNKI